MKILEINSLETLTEYGDAWRALLAATPTATFFHTPEWLEVYWRHFGADKRLRVLLAYEGSELVGVVPLMVVTETTRAGQMRFLTYTHDYWGTLFGPIGRDSHVILRAALEHILSTPRDWDALEFRWADGAEFDWLADRRPLPERRFQMCRGVHEHTSLIDLDGNWETYLQGRTSKWRNNLKRWKRKLEKLGPVEYRRYRPAGEARGEGDPRWDLYEDCLRVSRNSWQHHSTNGFSLLHPQVRDFLRDTHEVAARRGALDLNLLYIDGEPMAFAYNYRQQGRLMGLRIGYDTKIRNAGAGNVMYTMAIEDSFRRGDWVYDLGPGSLECKRHLRTELRPMCRYSYFPVCSVRPNILRLKRMLDTWRSTTGTDGQAA